MRYVGDLITAVRNRTHNQEFSVGSGTSGVEDVVEGIGDQTILEFLNEAQDHIQAAIVNLYPVEFVERQVIDVVSGQEAYSIPDNVFIDNRILSVQYSTTGNDRDYYNLAQRNLRDRTTDTTHHPSWYIRRSGQILLNPVPQTSVGKFRVEYYRELDNLALRAGQATTLTVSSSQITAITLSTSDDLSNLISNVGDKFFCVNDKLGAVEAYNVGYTSYDSGTGVVTLDGNHTLDTGQDPQANDFVTVGRYTTTHSKLPTNLERYLIAYAAMRVLQLDSSADWQDEAQVLTNMEQDILDSFGDVDEDVKEFPILDKYILY